MSSYQYHIEQQLPVSLQKAWDFFSSPRNLALITPPELDLKILTKTDLSKIYSGLRIQYAVKPLFGMSMHWETQIEDVKEPYLFKDIQLKGPYVLWEHTHTFSEQEDGVLMVDSVLYKLPFGVLGDIAHFLFVRNKICKIFEYRNNTLKQLFT